MTSTRSANATALPSVHSPANVTPRRGFLGALAAFAAPPLVVCNAAPVAPVEIIDLVAEYEPAGVEVTFEQVIDRQALALDIQQACGLIALTRPQREHLEVLRDLRHGRSRQPHLAFPKNIRDEKWEAALYKQRLSKLECGHCQSASSCALRGATPRAPEEEAFELGTNARRSFV